VPVTSAQQVSVTDVNRSDGTRIARIPVGNVTVAMARQPAAPSARASTGDHRDHHAFPTNQGVLISVIARRAGLAMPGCRLPAGRRPRNVLGSANWRPVDISVIRVPLRSVRSTSS
jgi:hypothetical protein